MTAWRMIDGLAEALEGIDAVVIDLWGVLHDGMTAFPAAIACLDHLRRAGVTICLLSNAPRRIGSVTAKLSGMGVGRERYDILLTSGEATNLALRQPPDAWHAGLGRRCYHLGPRRDDDIFDGLDLERVETPAQAGFVINTGIDAPSETLAEYEPVLQACAARRLPMICANPDLVVTVGEMIAICAGALAARYEALGGEVRYHGKPHRPIYDLVRSMAGISQPERVLAVGDSLRTDIAGAAGAGFRSVLVTSGIHREELGAAWGATPDPGVLARILSDAPAVPQYVLPNLRWQG